MATAIKFFCTVGLLGYGAVLIVDGHLSTGELVAFSLYTSEAVLPLARLIAVWDECQEARVALERIDDILGQEPEAQPAEARVDPGPLRGHIRFEQVSFQYGGRDGVPILREVNFEVLPGEHIAIMGQNGSGKSTLARLLLGLYRPTQGRILIDGLDLQYLNLAAYRQQVGVILQENLLLSGTIADTIALGDPHPDAERVIQAASQVGTHEFIAGFPQGYATRVGDLGLTLSGGQRQRLSLARACYREPRLLILDEPTSALDGVSAREIQLALETLVAGRTAVVITHDLATVRYADRILVLENGALVDQGAIADLTESQGIDGSLAQPRAAGALSLGKGGFE